MIEAVEDSTKRLSMRRSHGRVVNAVAEHHFKYLALPAFSPDLSDGRRFAEAVELFDDTGVGRFGIISFDSKLLHPSYVLSGNSTALTVRPERFKVRSEKLASIEKFLAKAKPDISVRV
jgi:hypothetical protein